MSALLDPGLASPLGMLFLMLAGHALADGPLQPRELSEAKRSPDRGRKLQALLVHGLVHGGCVALATGLWPLGAAEVLAHMTIDWAKGRGSIDHATDQLMHALCKVAWVSVAAGGVL